MILRNAIVILTQPQDPTADVVQDRLQDLGQPVVRVDTMEFPRSSRLTSRWGQDGRLATVLHTADGDIDLSSARSIWHRRPGEFGFASTMTDNARAFAGAEARQAFTGALLNTPAIWMNRPAAESVASVKMVQLEAAVRRGLTIPETVVTNDPEAARAFLDAAGSGEDTIYKRLATVLLWTNDQRLTAFETEKVDDAARIRLDNVAVTPCLFQRYVPKAYEIRVTVVAGQAIAARVDSQSSEKGHVDWRVDPDLRWDRYTLPPDVEQAVIDVVDDLGLLFGAVDLIRRPDGGYTFLEVNPSGQWAWFNDDITLPIRDAIVELLASPETNARVQMTSSRDVLAS